MASLSPSPAPPPDPPPPAPPPDPRGAPPPPSPDALDEQTVETVSDAALWRRLVPWLSVERASRATRTLALLREDAPPDPRAVQREFVEEGFFQVSGEAESAAYADAVDRLRRGVEALHAAGWPANFIFAYDEAWDVIRAHTRRLRRCNGGSRFLGDVYAWRVDPAHAQRGWGPHRDRMGSGPGSFREDGTAMLSTSWLALTDANPSNSCLVFVPARVDAAFRAGDAPGCDTLADVFAGRPDAYQAIRAMPVARGSLLHFSHRTIHWGSAATPTPSLPSPGPRIAMSWVVGDERFERRALRECDELGPLDPPVAWRVALVAGQLINYAGQTGLRKGHKSFYFRVFAKHQRAFTDDYVDKVRHLHLLRDAPKPAAADRPKVDYSKFTYDADESRVARDRVDGIRALFGSSEEEEDSAAAESAR